VLFAKQRLVIEVDGDRYHNTPWRRALDAHKQDVLENARYRVLRLSDDDGRDVRGTEMRISTALGRPT
jgi:very-short-patch-repair endonuclease